MAWSSLTWLLYWYSDQRPRTQIPAQPWVFRHCLGYVIGVRVSSPASWIDLVPLLWVVALWVHSLDILCSLPQALSLSLRLAVPDRILWIYS